MKVSVFLISYSLLVGHSYGFSAPVFAKTAAKAPKKVAKKVAVSKAAKKKAPPKKAAPAKKGEKKAQAKTDDAPTGFGGPVGLAGKGMGLLSPLFKLEAKVQAGALCFAADIVGAPFRVYPDELRQETKKSTKGGKPILYTYGLSPFSGEAKKILEPYDVIIEELGPEWFLLGPKESEKRIVLSELSPNEQTSLPHLFYKGESLGGLSTGGRNDAGIVGLQETGTLDKLFSKKKGSKR